MLDLRKNGDLSAVLPAEVLENPNDPQAILAAYRRFAKGKMRPLGEAKLLVVGEEAVGKTSLLRYLIHDQSRDPSEKKTKGIATQEKIETKTWSPDASGARLNVWDFGGQEMMHGTHRFFLTARSLYLLVLEDRREDDRSIYGWLKTIKNRAAGSPILVVINKSDKGKKALCLDEVRLREDYPEIIGFFRTSCNDDDFSKRSIWTLREQIVEAVAQNEGLKHVRDLFPESWLRIKDDITTLAAKRAVLPLAEFQTLCEAGEESSEKITDEDERRALLRLLNDLGTIVAHGLEPDARAVQREITLLDPNWLTEAIYTILTSADCAELEGEFTASHVSAWLDPEVYPQERHEFILDMMQDEEVGLCFRLPGRDEQHYLVPEALPASVRYLANWPADCLRFRYRYDFLPRGLVPRFIVQAHDLLATLPTRWRTGAVFKVQDCSILVEADTDKREIDIQVDGPVRRRRAALAIITHHLETIHALNPECGATARVPLPDQPDVDVSYDHLLKLEEKYGPTHEFDPEGADRAYTVAELLDGVRHEQCISHRLKGKGGTHYEIKAENVNINEVSGSTNGDVIQVGKINKNTMPKKNWANALTSWRFFSLAAAVAAVVLANVLYQINSVETRLAVASSAAIFVVVYLVVASFSPEHFYRRWIGRTILVGLMMNMGGIAFDAHFIGKTATTSFHWDGTVSLGFNIAWAAIVAILAVLEWQRTRTSAATA